jgi:peptidoglycan/LPS O-acetylase OafA/YrhL
MRGRKGRRALATISTTMAVATTGARDRVAPAAPGARVRLDFLDGLRGLAALYVVLYHASHELWIKDGLPAIAQQAVKVLSYGHFAVAVFIVLSGYCLMLPVVRSSGHELSGGFTAFAWRRARRILPPYYAALALALLCIAAVPALRSPGEGFWESAVPAFTLESIASHVFLVHNLDADTVWRINPPMWSVATEWQIYFVFPALLLPVWRRAGTLACVGTAFAVGLAPHFLLDGRFDVAAPWYIGLFALGMAAATLGFSTGSWEARLNRAVPWRALTYVAVATIAVPLALFDRWWWDHLWFADPQVGLAAACFIAACAHASSTAAFGARPLALRLLESPPCRLLGAFSYSLYLVHLPFLTIVSLSMRDAGVDPFVGLAVMLLVAVPAVMALSYGFHLVFEKRFMSGSPLPAKRTSTVPARAAVDAEPVPQLS